MRGRRTRWLERGLGALIGFTAGSVLRHRRHHVQIAMSRAGLPASLVPAYYRRQAEDLVGFLRATPRPVRCSPAFEAALAGQVGQPKVFFASHTGHWEDALAGMSRRLPLVAIVKTQSQAWAEAQVARRRAARGVRTLPAEDSLQPALGFLRAGSSVVALGDQAPRRQRHAVRCDFLGAPCFVDKSPALLAALAQAPLWVVAQRREGDAVRLELLTVLHPPARDRNRWVAHATREATAVLEAFVRAHPLEWLWLHRRWKLPPP